MKVKELKDFPTIDAVEVVRCKNCKHGDPVYEACSTGDYYCLLKDIYTYNWDFCSRGVKKNEENAKEKTK